MAKAVGTPQNSYCFLAKVRASLLDSTATPHLPARRGAGCRYPPTGPVPSTTFSVVRSSAAMRWASANGHRSSADSIKG